ncbi:hypothetical protein CQ018_10225 [Arthrobacter sp. MYb227]|uniref:hypothetical protein n=1 Tax=Arthrobacter sp. MYb227 TaxID=1848601 RepID=UPI000CFAC04A|nr:hypothetical protein [Arthrobacter sp. MYb227]PQZ92849.1 hypothetical protein CQ018_10225 [Arthrobacter sp. MYb227]
MKGLNKMQLYNDWNRSIESIVSSEDEGVQEAWTKLADMSTKLSKHLNGVTLWSSVTAGAALSVLLTWGSDLIVRNVSLIFFGVSILALLITATHVQPRLLRLSHWLRELERAERIVEQAVLVTSISLHPQLLIFASSVAESLLDETKISKMVYNSTKMDEDVNKHKRLAQSYAAGLACTRINFEGIRKSIEFEVDVTIDRIRSEATAILRETANIAEVGDQASELRS